MKTIKSILVFIATTALGACCFGAVLLVSMWANSWPADVRRVFALIVLTVAALFVGVPICWVAGWCARQFFMDVYDIMFKRRKIIIGSPRKP